jgi:predicted transcriptional regulator
MIKNKNHVKIKMGRGKGIGTRGGATPVFNFANTKHLQRIINYLSEIKEPLIKTKISKETGVNYPYLNDALLFLEKHGFIKKLTVNSGRKVYYINNKREIIT